MSKDDDYDGTAHDYADFSGIAARQDRDAERVRRARAVLRTLRTAVHALEDVVEDYAEMEASGLDLDAFSAAEYASLDTARGLLDQARACLRSYVDSAGA